MHAFRKTQRTKAIVSKGDGDLYIVCKEDDFEHCNNASYITSTLLHCNHMKFRNNGQNTNALNI